MYTRWFLVLRLRAKTTQSRAINYSLSACQIHSKSLLLNNLETNYAGCCERLIVKLMYFNSKSTFKPKCRSKLEKL